MLVQWEANKVVSVTTNFENNSVLKTIGYAISKTKEKNADQPKIISTYNKHMGGVDKKDGLRSNCQE